MIRNGRGMVRSLGLLLIASSIWELRSGVHIWRLYERRGLKWSNFDHVDFAKAVAWLSGRPDLDS